MYILKAVAQAGVVAWGSNATGQGAVPAGLSNVVAVAAGSYDSVALLSNGTVVVWGVTNSCPMTNVPPDLTNTIAIAAGPFHHLALRTDGTVRGWGCDDRGQLDIPEGLTNVTCIAAGYYHSLAARKDGTVVSWGGGPLSFPADLTNAIAVAGGYQFGLALRSDRTVAFGSNPLSQVGPPPPGLSDVISIAAGFRHGLALKRDGTVIVWGDNNYGQLNVPPNLTNAVWVAAGHYHNLALRSDGTVAAWGADDSGQIEVPSGLSNVGLVAAGQKHSLAVTREGAPFFVVHPQNCTTYSGHPVLFNTTVAGALPLTLQWKSNATNVPSATNSLFYLAACKSSDSGSYLVAATNSFGTTESAKANLVVIDSAPSIHTPLTNTLAYPGKQMKLQVEVDGSWPLSYQWYFNDVPVPGASASELPFNSVSPADAGIYMVTASNSFGMISNSGTLRLPPVLSVLPEAYSPPGVTDVVSIALTEGGAGALMRNGTVAAWRFDNGQFQIVPPEATNVVALAADSAKFIALRRDGSVVEWYAAGGFIIPHPELTNAVSLAGGALCWFAVKADGTVNAYGNFYIAGGPQAATVPAGLSNVVAVAAGSAHALALHADGRVTGWGYNNFGQISIPSDLSNVVAVAASQSGSAAVTSDGTVLTWGYPPTNGISSAVAIALANNNSYPSGVALTDHGTITGWGYAPEMSFPLTNVSAIAARNWSEREIIVLAGYAAPFFTILPSSRALNAGSDAPLAAQVTGTLPLDYQWQLNGTNLPNATNCVLMLSNVQSANAGTYGLVVSNPFGITTGAVATVVVTPTAPTIIQQPTNQTVMRGNTGTFSVSARGSLSLTYQWKFYGTNLPDATNSSLTLTNIQSGNNGFYSVGVTNIYGGLLSSNATLAVIIPLAASINTTGLVWTTSGDAPWFGQAFVTYDGSDAAQSGHIIGNQQSVLQTAIVGPGSISFWWKVSSEQFYDILKFSTNGIEAARISGDVNWQQRSFPLGSGVQTLTWVYLKDSSTSDREDAGWLDQVSYTGVSPPYLLQPFLNGSSFSASLQTVASKNYFLEFKNSLLDSNWTALPAVIGDGTVQILIDTNAPGNQRFYRVRTTP